VVVGALLAGCRYYYTKPGAGYADFSEDHHACVKDVGVPSSDGHRAFVSATAYRGCMKMRGWAREERPELGAGWFRGLEDDDVVAIGAPPPPPRAAGEPSPAMREHCRAIYLNTTDWRSRIPEYNACLAR
jgi:hypothetical protein